MKPKETIEKAYGNVPKEIGAMFDVFNWVPEFRGVRYYWIRAVRFFTR
jgi:hypothetical protein